MVQDFVAYLLIPLATLLLAGEAGWLTTNFSVIGSQGWGRLAFLIWGLLVGLYFYRQLGMLRIALGGGRGIELGRRLALIFFFLSIATPYLPQATPIRADIHVILALTATILLFFVVLQLALIARRKSPRGGRAYLLGMAVIGAVTSILLAVAGMVSTALEVFLVLSNLILLGRMERRQWN